MNVVQNIISFFIVTRKVVGPLTHLFFLLIIEDYLYDKCHKYDICNKDMMIIIDTQITSDMSIYTYFYTYVCVLMSLFNFNLLITLSLNMYVCKCVFVNVYL